MNTAYLDDLPALPAVKGLHLREDEKVVFVAEPEMVGTEKDRLLGMGPDFILTNRRLFINNRVGIWTMELAGDVSGWEKVEYKKLLGLAAGTYVAITLNTEIVYDNARQKLNGLRIYFNKTDLARFLSVCMP